MVCLVTGARGFIGSYYVRDAIRAGHRVIALDSMTDELIERVLSPEELREVTFVTASATDFAQFARLIAEHQVNCVLHLVSMLHPYSNQNPLQAEHINNLSFLNALEAARLAKVRLVWPSSVVVYGPREAHPPGPVRNDAPHHPTTVYAACKSYNEFLAHHYHRTWGVDHIGLRLTLVYGFGRKRGASSFVSRVIADAALGRDVSVPFSDDEIDWQYVEDVAQLLLKCSTVPSPKTRIFNTRTDVRPVRAGCNFLQRLLPGTRISYEPGVFGIAWDLDDSCLQEEIGFEWKFPMEAGITATANYVRASAGQERIAGPSEGVVCAS